VALGARFPEALRPAPAAISVGEGFPRRGRSIPAIERGDRANVTCNAVLDELREGDYPSRSPALALVANLPILEVTEAVAEIVAGYIRHRLMPADPAGDALHLALASYHKCDFLVTWNCQHLANANKFGHLRRVNGLLGLYVPVLATPLELLGEIDDFTS
jgi:hypothetical protein